MKKILSLLFLITTFVFAADAELDIIKKSGSLPKIEVSVSPKAMNAVLTNKVAKMIEKDLMVSGHFDVVASSQVVDYNSNPDMLVLSNKGTDLFVNLDANVSSFGGYTVMLKMYDVNAKKMVLNRSFSTSKEDRFPFIAHRIAITINKHLNAPLIDWMDKFVIFSQYKSARKADIIIADYTLTFQMPVIRGGLNIFPKWASDKQDSFYYTTYDSGIPTLVKTNIYTRQREVIMQSEGMLVASDVSSDSKKVLITASPNHQPDIYLYDTVTKTKKRLTTYKGIDVGAHFIDNEKRIVFVSDRLKYPNIFAKDIGGRGVERLVYHGNNNSSATTYKDYVVYTSRDRNNEFGSYTFNLYLMSTKSDFLKRLTSNGSNQFPKFSKDGESIIFLKTVNNRSSIGIIRLNYSKSFTFPLKNGKIQSIDW
ncbi:Tol-Pal system protein TolB [Halarcobacter bivalviorum]|uniref:Translocation protein TolB n=1 Tax=Halarcobacter bivalviorum TaxID=663364 RepID=A0AAX2A9A2_9BACT|nr:Tol-Pal system protein TolB [Halarcobacter bivalviorum]AXH12939.1 Tol-Pal system translocation protein TolB [Halarcobacter bivalviorum]RXK09251.1 translocation protein TolB [Halarcobacter bivalviorum]